MTFDYSQEVIDDFEIVLETDEGYDVIIYAGENENVEELHAHSNILHIRSQYFRAAFSKEWATKKDGKFIFKKPNISPQLFKIILRFIYCGKINFTKLQVSEVLGLLVAVDELDIQDLITCIREYIKYGFLKQSPIEILEIVYQHESFTDLWNYCLEKICEEPEILFDSDKFIDLKEPILELILKRDDLNLGEIVIWDSLLKWGLAQNPSISQDFTKWSKEEITIMKRTLHEFIPLIRLYYISSEDFLHKVYPLKKLLPKDLVDDLFTFYLANRKPDINNILPPRKSNFIYDSTLIKAQHFAIFASWIEKENDSYYDVRNIPYNFNLIYRASRDGNTIAKFHEKCDNKGATISILKLTNSEQIVGGYNSLQWDSNSTWEPVTEDSFIFSFKNRTSFQTAKVSYINDDDNQLYIPEDCGLFFGGGGSLQFHGGSWYSNSKLDIPGRFNVDDYEVFQIIKK